MPTLHRRKAKAVSPTLFSKTDFSLSTLISYIQHGHIGLPDLQRPFVWPNTKVRDLFDSMYRGYPVGYLLLWENAAAKQAKAIGADAKQAGPNLLVIDGQQRLTSLYSVFRGVPVKRENFKEERLMIAFRPLDSTFSVTDAAIRHDPTWIDDISIVWDEDRGLFSILGDYLDRVQASRELTPADRKTVERAISQLEGLKNYPFTALQLAAELEEEQVAEVFVRINSKGTPLKQADFILTLMSVFADAMRTDLESFCQACRVPTAKLASPFNYFLEPEPDQLLRVAVAVAFRRARLQHVYSLLRGKDLATGEYSEERREHQFKTLAEAQRQVLNIQTWHEFLKCVQRAGFRGAKQISSRNALLYTYALFLIGREYGVDHHRLRNLIARWFFFVSLTGRFTGSPESQMELDLADLRGASSADDFARRLEGVMESSLTNDYWDITLPSELATSSARSPTLFAYQASLCLLDARGLFSELKVADLLDPAIKAPKSALERHHLFPKKHLHRLGVRSRRDVNQIANYALMEWKTNIEISDRAPEEYWPELLKNVSPADRKAAHLWHALPADWEMMEYPIFLQERRRLLAQVIRAGFATLSGAAADDGDLESGPPLRLRIDGVTAIALRQLSWSVGHVFAELLGSEPLMDPSILRSDVARYLEELGDREQEEPLDMDTAHRVAERMARLLADLGQSPNEDHHRLAQAAVQYFLLEEDAEGDLSSPRGFRDDEAVVAAVEVAIGAGAAVVVGHA